MGVAKRGVFSPCIRGICEATQEAIVAFRTTPGRDHQLSATPAAGHTCG